MKDTPQDILENFQWLHPPGPGWGWGIWLSLLAVLLLLAGAVWYFLRRKKLGLSTFAPPPHHAALRALEALRQRLSEEHQREFVIEVSQVVRVYIQARFGLRAPHRSTAEFLREVQSGDSLLRDHRDSLAEFLSQCDLVKFAQRRVVLAEMNALLDRARQFVESTIPQPKPAVGKAE